MAQTVDAAGVAAAGLAVSGAGSGPQHQDENRRSRKPANTKFKQQQLPAWQPMLTARSVLPFLVAIGVAFIPIGIALFLSAANVVEKQMDYTQCARHLGYDGESCGNFTFSRASPVCKCFVDFIVDRQIAGPVFIYYGLDNFFQNHRKYVKSRDDNQLMGGFIKPERDANQGPSKECDPFAMANGTWGYAPCGAIANSLFNDTIKLNYLGNQEPDAALKKQQVGLIRTGIAWKSDRDIKFRNPRGAETADALKTEMARNNLKSPAYWTKQLWELDTEIESNNGLQNEDLIVWMRTAAFPAFRKLYRRVDHSSNGTFAEGLPVGNYSFEIDYSYPVTAFSGRKYVIISSVSWIGGRNPFLGIAYMTVGCACLLLAAIFFFIHVRWGKNYESDAFAGLTVDTPYARRTLRSAFNRDQRPEPSSTTPASSSRSPMSSSRWPDIIPSSTEAGNSSNSRGGGTSPGTTATTPGSSQGRNNRTLKFGQDSPRLSRVDDAVKVQVVSSLGGLRTGQTIHELLNDVLASVTVVIADDDDPVNLSNRRSSPQKSIAMREDADDKDIRMRRRLQMMDQPTLVD